MAAMKTTAAQWWIWRITSPIRMSKLSRTTEPYALDTSDPLSGA